MRKYTDNMEKPTEMKKQFFLAVLCTLILTGCSHTGSLPEEPTSPESEPETIYQTETARPEPETSADASDESTPPNPEQAEMDWADYFDGFNGAAVFYDATNNRYMIYNEELAATRTSPCSTFKIISSLIALEHKILSPQDSTRTWSGESFWNENWNRDTDFEQAFRDSCVWYFREVIDEIGPDLLQEELNRLQYGNCDISDWEGRQNTNNQNRALTGFWIESSLAISPKEQTQVMERIFGNNSSYSAETLQELKRVMAAADQEQTAFSLYGKTGMGKAQGVTVDAWYTGFSENAGETLYFCVYLGKTDGKNASSAIAKQIAVALLTDYYAQNS